MGYAQLQVVATIPLTGALRTSFALTFVNGGCLPNPS